MKHSFHSIDYSYLRPSLSKVDSTEQMTTHQENGQRWKFYHVSETINEEEKQHIGKFLEKAKEEDMILPNWWSNDDSLRYVDTNKLEIDQAITQLKEHLKWIESLKIFTLSDQSANLLKSGNVYFGHRDKEGYPLLIVRFGTLDMKKQENQSDFIEAVLFAVMVMKKYMMLPFTADKFNTLIDLEGQKLFGAGLNVLKGILSIFKTNFNGMSNKTFICNGGMGFGLIWKGISMLMSESTKNRTVVMKAKVWTELTDHFGIENIEMKYGGQMDNFIDVKETWPPVTSVTDPVSIDELNGKGRSMFYMISKKEDDVFFSARTMGDEVFEQPGVGERRRSQFLSEDKIETEKDAGGSIYQYYFWRFGGMVAIPTVIYFGVLAASMLTENYWSVHV